MRRGVRDWYNHNVQKAFGHVHEKEMAITMEGPVSMLNDYMYVKMATTFMFPSLDP